MTNKLPWAITRRKIALPAWRRSQLDVEAQARRESVKDPCAQAHGGMSQPFSLFAFLKPPPRVRLPPRVLPPEQWTVRGGVPQPVLARPKKPRRWPCRLNKIRQQLAASSLTDPPFGYAIPLPWCAYCGREMTEVLHFYGVPAGVLRPTDVTDDHIVPRASLRDPRHAEVRNEPNRVRCCSQCNQLKADRPLLEFLLDHPLMRWS